MAVDLFSLRGVKGYRFKTRGVVQALHLRQVPEIPVDLYRDGMGLLQRCFDVGQKAGSFFPVRILYLNLTTSLKQLTIIHDFLLFFNVLSIDFERSD
jgi:hypothetical protein